MGYFTQSLINAANKPVRTKTAPKKKNPEGTFQDAVIKYLRWHNWKVLRLNSGVQWSKETNMPFRSYVFCETGGSSGAPDLFAFKQYRTILLECKSLKGRQSESQKEFERIIQNDAEYYVIKNLDEVGSIINK